MIELYYWTTPNGHKITIFLEEAGLPYKIIPINIGQGEQFAPTFLQVSPNNKIPAIVDRAPADGGEPISIFESGAILLYLADKTGQFIGKDLRNRAKTLEWLFWQMAGLGPMCGQYNHFANYADNKIPYAIERYHKETNRLFAVLDKQLAAGPFIAGDYSIADMASYPWVKGYERFNQNIDDFPNIKRWLTTMQGRKAVERAYAKAEEVNPSSASPMSEEAKRILFGQDANTLRTKK